MLSRTIGSTFVDPAKMCTGQSAGLAVIGGTSVVAITLHNAPLGTPAQALNSLAFTLMSPERTREMALALFTLADEAQKRNEQAKEGS